MCRNRARAAGALAVLALLGACGETPDQFQARCEAQVPPARISVSVTPVAFATSQELDSRGLMRLLPEPAKHRTLGLTRATLTHSVRLDTAGLAARGSQAVCVRPQVEVKLAFDPMTVYLASDLAGNECLRQEVWLHEMQHVRVYEQHLDEAAGRIRQQLKAHFGNRLFVFASRAALQRDLELALGQVLAPLVDAEMQSVETTQAAVDTAEEYARLARVCP